MLDTEINLRREGSNHGSFSLDASYCVGDTVAYREMTCPESCPLSFFVSTGVRYNLVQDRETECKESSLALPL